MKTKTLFTIIFFLLTLTLLSSIAAAEKFEVISAPVSYDFLVSTPSAVNACQCAETSFPISITNTGSYTTIFSLYSDDSKIHFSNPSLTLQPGEFGQVIASRNIACFASGSNDINIRVKSSFHFTKDVKTTLINSNCQKTEFAFDKVNLNESICQAFNTTLFITNAGSLDESYTIKPLDGTVTLSAGSVDIPAGKTAAITASYDLPCDLYGIYNLRYKVDAIKAQKSYKLKQTLTIPYNYNFDLRATPEINFCAQDSKVVVLELENKNNFSDDFKFDIDAPRYASVDFPKMNGEKVDVLTVAPNTTVRLNITLSPGKKDLGKDVIDISVTDKFGGLTKKLSVNVSASNCYDLSTAFWSPREKDVCGGDYLKVPFTLINNGDSDGTITLDAQGVKYVYFQNSTYDIPAHSEKEVVLTINMSNNTWGTFPVTLNSYSAKNLINSYKFTLVSYPREFCYKIKPGKNVYNVRYDKNSFSIDLKNVGLRAGDYLVDLESVNNSLNTFAKSFSLEPSSKLWLGVNITNPQAVDSEQNITLTLVERNSHTSFTYPLTVKFTNYSWIERTFWSVWDTIYYTNNCLLSSIFLAFLILVFVLLVIFRSYKKRFYKTPKVLLFISLIILLLAAAVILSFKGLPHLYTSYNLETNSTTHLLLEEDAVLTINLSNYFFDPDGDIVTYGVSSIDSDVLNYSIDNTSLTLYPAKDYNGQTNIVLFATDSYGLTAKSKQIRVDVLPVEDYTYSELYFKLCIYIDWVLLFILAILIFLFFSFKKSFSKNKKTLAEVVVVRSEDNAPKKDNEPENIFIKNVSSKNDSANKVTKKTSIAKNSSKKKVTKKTSIKNSAKKISVKSTKNVSTKK